MSEKKANGQSRPQPTDDQLRIAELENRCLALSDRIEALVAVIGQHEANAVENKALVTSALKVTQELETELRDLYAANAEQLRRHRDDGTDNVEHLVPYLQKAAACLNKREQMRGEVQESLARMRELGVL